MSRRARSRATPGPPPAATGLRAVFLQGWRPYAWLALIGLVLYAQTLGFGLTYLDDDNLIVKNYRLISDWSNLGRAFCTDMSWQSPGYYYRPLATVSLMLDAAWAGTRLWGYHLTNVLLHLLDTGLLLWVLLELGHRRRAAFAAALVFTVHPALAHAVAFIPGRYETVLACFALLAFGALVRYLRAGGAGWYAVNVGALALAMFSKETALILPAAMLWYAWQSGADHRARRVAVLALGWAAVAAGYLLARQAALHWNYHVFNTPAENLVGLLSYIGKVALPVNLSVMPEPRDLPVAYGLIVAAAAGLLFAAGGIADRRRFWFGLGWFLLFLLPTALRVMDFAYILEQRLYLPLIGALLMALESSLLRRWAGTRAFRAALAAVLILCAAQTVRHSRTFAADLPFWRNATQHSPHLAFAHALLGERLAEHGQLADAEDELKQAVALKPDAAPPYADLGLVYYRRGLLDSAAAAFAICQGIDPGLWNAFDNLGLVYLKQDKPSQAEQQFRRAIAVSPQNPAPWNHLSLACYLQGKYQEAIDDYRAAVKYGHEYNPEVIRTIEREMAGPRRKGGAAP
ncbi:MAG TPA: tetratricopeptide repeat protein [Candidatus Edwardsbacteria bacterium]|nr:tetratricopeptide repeat protein [Candidatus Edwardsbacteria bacterium]